MISLDAIRKPIEGDLELFEQFIRRNFNNGSELLSAMIDYVLSTRGKSIRPILVLLSAGMNSPERKSSAGNRTLLAAMLVEMIHSASLIHDDVIDESDTRRGKASVNAKWQSRNAIILGDYILARNMALGMQSAQYDILNHVIGSIATLCEGEIIQSERAQKMDITREAYLEIIYKKTASLLGISASVGALSVGAASGRVAQMRRFGESLGMAFQIKDDILDYTREAHTGKPANNDLREGKITLPLLSVLDASSEERRADLMRRVALCRTDEQQVDYLHNVVESEGGIAFAQQVLQSYITKAVDSIADFDPSPYKKSLIELSCFVAERDK